MDTKKKYTPRPADTSDVALPESLSPYLEAIAENVHETWAKGRIDAGWTYGQVRDEENKRHPCLVPYCDLSESEKDYDRHTAISTLKFICKLGFKISN
ncbi:MAG: Ryanodine receptor Ryr [Kiritimatiellae bacterium]|nr:Ryanodine receptor Ryr [Kiritimatiellia bacterium]MBQ3314941.1 Ryanodine receptor Ryr [Kiritimatiellia bacterium]